MLLSCDGDSWGGGAEAEAAEAEAADAVKAEKEAKNQIKTNACV